MKTGIELIAIERQEQIEKHGRTVEKDVELNSSENQLQEAAYHLIGKEWLYVADNEETCPIGWNQKVWNKMFNKEYKERLIIAGALIAAEIDRLNYNKD
jgi:hypothetical protein